MTKRKFKVGQAVEYHPPRGVYAPPGGYHVTAELPVRFGEFEYRLKHPRENHERVAAEGDLSELWKLNRRSGVSAGSDGLCRSMGALAGTGQFRDLLTYARPRRAPGRLGQQIKSIFLVVRSRHQRLISIRFGIRLLRRRKIIRVDVL
jgi:hypothetical protein